jgi:uncharacterized membrane protein
MATTFEQAPVKAAATKRAKPADRHWRSIAKAVSWRVVGTIDTMIISYLVTGKIKWALSIGFVELFTKVFLFYLHERAWHRIPYGTVADKSE